MVTVSDPGGRFLSQTEKPRWSERTPPALSHNKRRSGTINRSVQHPEISSGLGVISVILPLLSRAQLEMSVIDWGDVWR